jgi:hypothetical protein
MKYHSNRHNTLADPPPRYLNDFFVVAHPLSNTALVPTTLFFEATFFDEKVVPPTLPRSTQREQTGRKET